MSMSVEVSLDEVLARHNVGISGAEFLAELDADLSRVTDPAAAPLSTGVSAFLRMHAGPAADEVLNADPAVLVQDARRAEVARMAGLLADSVGIAEAALLLGVDRSRLSQRLSAGRLWGFRLGPRRPPPGPGRPAQRHRPRHLRRPLHRARARQPRPHPSRRRSDRWPVTRKRPPRRASWGR